MKEQAKNKAAKPSKKEEESERRHWLKIGIPLVILISFTGWLTGWFRDQAMDATTILMISAPMKKQVEVPNRRNIYGKKLVALTFDDGPFPDTTNRLLDILREKEVRVTFFELGTMASRYPDVTKRVYDEKHELASHTMSHRQLNKISAGEIEAEARQARDVLKSITGEEPSLVRPPYGAINGVVAEHIGAPMILWTVDTEDWKSKDAGSVLARARSAAFDGAIILMHDIYESTVDGAAMVIDALREDGYEFVTVSELAEMRGVELRNGEAYGSFKP